ncbi:TRAP transporter large permease [Propionivibrio dicarboxylicus]|uniref:TRAP transporter large permease protein n=1 Tax=Propionivibrio dicarboxylicus TaxID=83767 RepID=A0A1G8KDZ6_9RHOO|nr:TRAP transporter large permease subunit [Propionivibrio dicarboxylicus]SDI41635.1 TRAP transporter, DctM subunit [Propionivibrio dicarboxylicus]
MSLVIVIVFGLLLFLSFPVAHGLVIGSTAGILWGGKLPLFAVIQQLFSPTQSFPLIAIPFFVMAGELMMTGKLGTYLIDFATDLVGRFRGGHAQVSVLGTTLFGGVSGSAVADATALGSVLIPWQKKMGYPAAFCGATMAAASTIDILIPPSIPMILYSLVSNASIGALFVAGILPGLLLAGGFLAVCNISARMRGFPYEKNPIEWRVMASRGLYAMPALLLPVFILVALRFGVATPTEISTIAVSYSLLVSAFLYRDLTWERVRRSIVFGGVATGVVLLLIMGSMAAGWVLTLEQVPERFIEWAKGSFDTQASVIMMMNLMMLAAGMFVDLPAAILLLGPLFVPLAQTFQIDLIQLGIIMVVNLAIGLYTPPVGTTLFIGSMLAKSSIGQTVKELLPFYAVGLLVLGMMSYVPALTIYYK